MRSGNAFHVRIGSRLNGLGGNAFHSKRECRVEFVRSWHSFFRLAVSWVQALPLRSAVRWVGASSEFPRKAGRCAATVLPSNPTGLAMQQSL